MFDSRGTELVYALCMEEGPDEEIETRDGDVVRLMRDGRNMEQALRAEPDRYQTGGSIDDDALAEIAESAGVILFEDSGGFLTSEVFDDGDLLEQAWDAVAKEAATVDDKERSYGPRRSADRRRARMSGRRFDSAARLRRNARTQWTDLDILKSIRFGHGLTPQARERALELAADGLIDTSGVWHVTEAGKRQMDRIEAMLEASGRTAYGRNAGSGKDRTRWDALHARQDVALEKAKVYENSLNSRYGWASGWRNWITRTERAKLERLEAAAGRIGDAIVELLVSVSPRGDAWLSGAPAWWIREKLTWEDATRPATEPLSVEVPAPYGRLVGLK